MTHYCSPEHVVQIYLQDHRPRLNCFANIQMICSQLAVDKNKMFPVENIPKVLPIVDIDRAIVHLHGRLADNYAPQIQAFFQRHPEFADLEANRRIVGEALERSHVTMPSENDLEELLDVGNQSGCHGELIKSAEAQQAESDEYNRQQLSEKLIANLVPLKLDGADVMADRRRIETRRKREEEIRRMNLPQLKELREQRRLQESDTADLHAALKAEDQKRQEANSQYLPWPGLYAPRGSDVREVGVPLTKILFARLDVSEQKRLLRVFGQDAINKAIREASKS